MQQGKSRAKFLTKNQALTDWKLIQMLKIEYIEIRFSLILIC